MTRRMLDGEVARAAPGAGTFAPIDLHTTNLKRGVR